MATRSPSPGTASSPPITLAASRSAPGSTNTTAFRPCTWHPALPAPGEGRSRSECWPQPGATADPCQGRAGLNAPIAVSITQSATADNYDNLRATVQVFIPPATGTGFIGATDSSGQVFLDGSIVAGRRPGRRTEAAMDARGESPRAIRRRPAGRRHARRPALHPPSCLDDLRRDVADVRVVALTP